MANPRCYKCEVTSYYLSCSFVPQGLFRPPGCISIGLFCSTGITSTDRMHLYRTLLLHRDYFDRPDASLSDSFAPQGLLYPGQMHLYLALLCRRDYFARPDASHHWKAIAKNISARPFRQIQICITPHRRLRVLR